jgi:tyrosinase
MDASSDPEDGETLGRSEREVIVQGAGADTRLRLNPAALKRALASLAPTGGKASASRVYLAFHELRGTHDASVLRVSLHPGGSVNEADRKRSFQAGSLGLYGLRRASLGGEDPSAQGLEFVLEVTPFFTSLAAAGATPPEELTVSIRPRRELSSESSVAIGRIRIFQKNF